MRFTCSKCGTVTDIEVYFNLDTVSCVDCASVFKNKNGVFDYIEKFEHISQYYEIKPGQKVFLRGKEYIHGGVLVKKAHGSFYWREHILHTDSLEFCYISEAAGHFILLKEVDEKYDLDYNPRKLNYNSKSFNLYENTDAEIVSAFGFFDFDITKKKVAIHEYINPPFIVSIEKSETGESTFFGEHISRKEIKRAFNVKELPFKSGTGIVQPFFMNLKNLALVLCFTALLILFSHIYLNTDRTENQVLNTELAFDFYNNKDFVTKSFELKGSPAPLTVNVSSNVDNSWANLQVVLINEKTGEEVYASKDIEYYHGYTDGENWTEGSTSEEFNICGVGSGKYHLALTVLKAPEDLLNKNICVQASWSKPSMWNVWMIFIFMTALLVGMFFINRYFETQRWEDSDYSPFYNETEED